jgi:hypothetical protein
MLLVGWEEWNVYEESTARPCYLVAAQQTPYYAIQPGALLWIIAKVCFGIWVAMTGVRLCASSCILSALSMIEIIN